MTDLAALTPESFTPCKGTGFLLRLEPPPAAGAAMAGAGAAPQEPAAPVSLELVEVNAAAAPRPGQPRLSFSLVFSGPRGLFLPQRIYRLEHESLGVLELFLVSVQPDARGALFEAVFN
jgi:hypothetical protein